MTNADKLFKQLGYIRQSNTINSDFYYSENRGFDWIEFVKQEHKVHIRADLTVQELKAINMKCKELNWIE